MIHLKQPRAALIVLCLVVVGGLAGCEAITPLPADEAYIQADRATLAAVEPVLTKYLEADSALTPEDLLRWENLFITWGLRIDRAEEAITNE